MEQTNKTLAPGKCFFGHKWTKWTLFEFKMKHIPSNGVPIDYLQDVQQRECLVCGKIQREKIIV